MINTVRSTIKSKDELRGFKPYALDHHALRLLRYHNNRFYWPGQVEIDMKVLGFDLKFPGRL